MDTATGKLVAAKEESGDGSESETGSEEDVTGKPLDYKTAAGKPHALSKSDCQGSPKAEKSDWSHNLDVTPVTIHHTEAAFPIVRGSTDEDMTTLWMIWTCIFLFGACFEKPLIEQQFILDKTTKRIYIT